MINDLENPRVTNLNSLARTRLRKFLPQGLFLPSFPRLCEKAAIFRPFLSSKKVFFIAQPRQNKSREKSRDLSRAIIGRKSRD